MKYKLVAENPIEAEALKSNITAQALFDPILPVLQARALMVAVRSGIFDEIGGGSSKADDLSTALSLDAGVLRMLLRVLSCAGYLISENDEYRLTEVALKSLCSRSPLCLSAWVELNYIQWNAITALENVLRTGQGIDLHQNLGGEKEWRTYQQAMLETARPVADWVASHVPIRKGAKRLLDIGGSHGLYGASICRRNPPLRSEVLELPDAVEPARNLAKQEGIDDVVVHRAGNALTDELGYQIFDAVFLGNILHHFTPDQNQKLLHKISSVLIRGGTVAIWDLKKPDFDSKPDLISDGFALLFRITSSTECYTEEEYCSWMSTAGFINIETISSPTHVLITAQVG